MCIRDRRKAIAIGIKDSLETIQETGVGNAEANQLFMFTQWTEMMNEFATVSYTHLDVYKRQPQEMFLGIALHLAMNEEPTQRLAWVKRFYDMLSKLEVTMATPCLLYTSMSACSQSTW